MLYRCLAQGLLLLSWRQRTITRSIPQVLKTLNIISFGMNTYTVVEASLKTRHLIPFRMRTYGKSPHNAFTMNTYKKPRGVGVLLLPSGSSSPGNRWPGRVLARQPEKTSASVAIDTTESPVVVSGTFRGRHSILCGRRVERAPDRLRMSPTILSVASRNHKFAAGEWTLCPSH
jgi:hypothetical protein